MIEVGWQSEYIIKLYQQKPTIALRSTPVIKYLVGNHMKGSLYFETDSNLPQYQHLLASDRLMIAKNLQIHSVA
jgi:hypothetical protein